MLFKSSTLILIAIASAFFPRVLDALGAPPAINFLHFATIPFACGFSLFKSRIRNTIQFTIIRQLLLGLLLLLSVMTVSAILNNAGVVNVILSFLLLGEPFILLLGIVCLPMTLAKAERFNTWLMRFGFINLIFALVQNYVLRVGAINPDYIKGVFIGQGAGHVVGASVSLTFGVYYFITARTIPIWVRFGLILLTFDQVLSADAKQVLLVFLVAGSLLLITKLKSAVEAIKYLIIIALVLWTLLWCMQNIPAFDAYNTWVRPEMYGPDGEATLLKSSGIRIILSHFESPLNWLFGLGPGHTVGRLGGWLLWDYADLLNPLGATTNVVSLEVWRAVGESWLGDQSSMFSPFFGWSGIWGDLGFLGLGAYLYLAFVVWRLICMGDMPRFFLLTIFVFGLVFSQMEEPGYMLFVASLVGIYWHLSRLRQAEELAEQLLAEQLVDDLILTSETQYYNANESSL